MKFGVRELALAFIGRALCGPDASADRGLPRPVSLIDCAPPSVTRGTARHVRRANLA
jgi:hypothetical protein